MKIVEEMNDYLLLVQSKISGIVSDIRYTNLPDDSKLKIQIESIRELVNEKIDIMDNVDVGEDFMPPYMRDGDGLKECIREGFVNGTPKG